MVFLLTVLFLEHIGLFDFLKVNVFKLTFSVKRVIYVVLLSVVHNEIQHSLIFFIVMESQSCLFNDWFKVLHINIVGLLQANNSCGPLDRVEGLLHRTHGEFVFLFDGVEFGQDLFS